MAQNASPLLSRRVLLRRLFFPQLFIRLSGLKAWVALAAIFSIALFGYYLVQGARYWQAWGDVSDNRREIHSLERKINSLPQSAESNPQSSSELERQLTNLEALERLFNYPGTDELLAMVSSTAADAGLELLSMRAEAPREETLDVLTHHVEPVAISAEAALGSGPEVNPAVNPTETPDVLAYQVQPITISLEGPPANLTQFLTSLQQRVPVVSAPNIRIAGMDGITTSKILLLFYLSPHESPEGENANAGSGDGGTG